MGYNIKENLFRKGKQPMRSLTISMLVFVCYSTSAKSPGPNEHITDRFDMVEVNHFCNKYGYTKLTQLIFWNYHTSDKKFHVHAWRLMKKNHIEKTLAGAEMHERHRRAIESQYKSLKAKQQFLSNSEYKGDFVGGPEFPVKNYKKNVYITTLWDYNFGINEFDFNTLVNLNGNKRRIQTKFFKESYTQYDPEVRDRHFLPEELRMGFSK